MQRFEVPCAIDLVIEILDDALDVHMSMLCVSQVFFHTEHKRLSCNSEILNMVIFEFELPFFFLFYIYQVLINEHLIYCQVRYLLFCVRSCRLHFI